MWDPAEVGYVVTLRGDLLAALQAAPDDGAAHQAAANGAQVVAFPELSLPGYPPRDLVERSSFLDRNAAELARLAEETSGLDLSIICGYASRAENAIGKRALNSAAVIERGQIVFRQHKTLLPTYDVFDEARYFRPAERVDLLTLRAGFAAEDFDYAALIEHCSRNLAYFMGSFWLTCIIFIFLVLGLVMRTPSTVMTMCWGWSVLIAPSRRRRIIWGRGR